MFSNLFRIETEGKIKLHKYRVFWKEGFSEREHVNKLLWYVSEKVKKPVVYRDKFLYSFTELKEDATDIECAVLEKEGVELLESLDIKSLGQIANFFERRLKPFSLYEEENLVILGVPVLKVFPVKGFPHLCVDYRVRLISNKNLQEEIEDGVGEEEIIGKEFRVLTSSSKNSFLVEEVFPVNEESAERYMKLSTSEENRKAWEKVKLLLEERKNAYAVKGTFRKSGTTYTYPALILRRVITVEDIEGGKFKYIRNPTSDRVEKILDIKRSVSKLMHNVNILIKDSFPVPEDLGYTPKIYDASGREFEVPHNVKEFLSSREFKPFLRTENIKVQPVFVGIDDKNLRKEYGRIFKEHVVDYIEDIGLGIDLLKPIYTQKGNRESVRESLEERFREIVGKQKPDIVVVFLKEFEEESYLPGGRTLYDIIKEELSFLRLPSQVILEKTIRNMDRFKAMNIVLGILGKTGNYPYKVRLEGETLYIGVDVSRREKERSSGSISMAGVCKFFSPDGSFLKYVIKKFSVEGEALEEKFVDFVASEIKKVASEGLSYKRVVIHRDGPMPERERRAFEEIFSRRGIENFELVSVIKRGNPRIFGRKGRIFTNPKKGLFLELDSSSFVLTTYNVSDKVGTHQPLRVSLIKGSTGLKALAEEILTLTLLNYSSFTLGKLPATVSHADKLAKFALKGFIKEGADSRMFWL